MTNTTKKLLRASMEHSLDMVHFTVIFSANMYMET